MRTHTLLMVAAVFFVCGVYAQTARYAGGGYDGYATADANRLLGLPSIDTVGRPTAVSVAGAKLSGTCELGVMDGSVTANVFVFYGTADGGTDTNAWAHSASAGTASMADGVKAVSAAVSGLDAGTLYYYRFFALDTEGGEGWADHSASFKTFAMPLADTGNRSKGGGYDGYGSLDAAVELYGTGTLIQVQ
jgi:hypothetical protein